MRRRIDLVNDHIITVKEMCQHFKMAPATAWRMILRGDVDSVKIGRSRRTSIECVAAKIAQQNQRPADADDVEADCRAAGI